MKKKNILFAGLALVVGLGVFTGFNNNYYQQENEEYRAEIASIKENADDVSLELIEKLEAKETPNRVDYFSVTSEDGSIDYIRVDGYSEVNDITIMGSSYKDNRGSIFLAKGDDRTWIDFESNLYHQDKRSDHDIPQIVTTNELSYGEMNILRYLGDDTTVEKTDFGYKVTLSDHLNYGYRLFDENGNFIESYLDNSQGKVTTKFLGSDDDVLAVYEDYMKLTEGMTYTDNIADVK